MIVISIIYGVAENSHINVGLWVSIELGRWSIPAQNKDVC
jgi:hypothetical protein